MTEDPARSRFAIIQAVRFAGVAMVLLGLLVLNHKLDWPAPVGYFLLINGMFDVFVLPVLLAKRWKSLRP